MGLRILRLLDVFGGLLSSWVPQDILTMSGSSDDVPALTFS